MHGSLLTPSWGRLRVYSFLNISEKLQRTSLPLLYPSLLLNKSLVSKIILLMLKPPQGQVRVRRSCPQPKILNLRMPLQLRMSSPRLKKLSLSPRLGMLSLRQLIPKKGLNQQRNSCRIFFIIIIFLSFYFLVASTTTCNVSSFWLMNGLFFLPLVSLFYMLSILLLLQINLNCCHSSLNKN